MYIYSVQTTNSRGRAMFSNTSAVNVTLDKTGWNNRNVTML